MKIEYKGQQVEAYSLIMRKENALDIIAGKKKIEIRAFSPKYESMFLHVDRVQKFIDDPQNEVLPFKMDAKAIHFYNYGNTWYLDVMIEEIGLAQATERDIKMLADEFDFHEYDDQWQQYAELPDGETPMFFWLALGEIISTNLKI
jgi:hypothetical protein